MQTIALTTKLMIDMIIVVDDDDADGNTKGIYDLSIVTCKMTKTLYFRIADTVALLTT